MPGTRYFEKSGLGKSLAKSKRTLQNKSDRHTVVLNDGSDYGKLNLRSVTQESSMDEFITIAQMAGDEFTKDRNNVTIITRTSVKGVLSEEEKKALVKEQEENVAIITIPRRPVWDSNMSPEELAKVENESFLDWRRNLAKFQEQSKLNLTPFEKNVEFWRQLWRVVERSDVLVQILDARNPLLFLSKDLQKYVKEVDPNKMNLVILNKADLLTETQRQEWAKYFKNNGIRAIFFSALEETTKISEEEENAAAKAEEETVNFDSGDEDDDGNDKDTESVGSNQEPKKDDQEDKEDTGTKTVSTNDPQVTEDKVDLPETDSSGKLMSREELIDYFQNIYPKDRPKYSQKYVTIGLIGYPNVGKSSTINSLLKSKKVSVSATPGKTKHFQTLFLNGDLCLCDCPGLVFPNFVSSKAEMILYGILPIDQMNDHVSPVNLLLSLIPGHVFEIQYSITLPSGTPTAEQLLNAYGYMRGFMTQRGLPDNPRSSRYILKDFVNGKIVYAVAPPGVDQKEFHKFTDSRRHRPAHITKRQEFLIMDSSCSMKTFDADYFSTSSSTAHSKGPTNVINFGRSNLSGDAIDSSSVPIAKPWRLNNKRNTRQKLRKAFAHLDIK